MCTLAIYFRCAPHLPLLIAANRDELYDRPTAEPQVIAYDPWVVAGQDLSAGGTWLGLNQHGLVVGMLNRRSADAPDPGRRSRGLLCLEALQTEGPGATLARLEREEPAAYNGFNMLIADAHHAYVASNRGTVLSITALDPGLHLLSNLELNDPTCPRIAGSYRLFADVSLQSAPREPSPLLRPLRRILSDHQTTLDPRGPTDTLCIHTPTYGTRSATIIAAAAAPPRLHYWHAAGPPCVTELVDVPLPAQT